MPYLIFIPWWVPAVRIRPDPLLNLTLTKSRVATLSCDLGGGVIE